jgi:hypothetical protein
MFLIVRFDKALSSERESKYCSHSLNLLFGDIYSILIDFDFDAGGEVVVNAGCRDLDVSIHYTSTTCMCYTIH